MGAPSPEETAQMLNKQYMGFNMDDPTSPLGVTLGFATSSIYNFTNNLFCNSEVGTVCFRGAADCKMSCALLNWKMSTDNYTLHLPFGNRVGYAFNQEQVESGFSKCSFLFDGATQNRYNNGCGSGAPGTDCSQPGTAYADICPSTGKTCTADDVEVTSVECEPFGLHKTPNSTMGSPCFFSGPSLNFPRVDPLLNHMRDMVQARVASGVTKDWNEVVLDERVLIPAMKKYPAITIRAFTYFKSMGSDGQKAAEGMRDKFCKDYGAVQIPVLGINDQSDFRPDGPFFVASADVRGLVATVV